MRLQWQHVGDGSEFRSVWEGHESIIRATPVGRQRLIRWQWHVWVDGRRSLQHFNSPRAAMEAVAMSIDKEISKRVGYVHAQQRALRSAEKRLV